MDPFLTGLLAQANQMRLAKIDSQGAASLGELVARLEALPDGATVTNADADVDSYRGYYEDLAITPGVSTVGALRTALSDAIGTTFEGYKGGDFTMSRNTRVWLAHYGTASGMLVTGLEVDGDQVTISTTDEEW